MTMRSMAITFADTYRLKITASGNSISEYRWFMDHKQATACLRITSLSLLHCTVHVI